MDSNPKLYFHQQRMLATHLASNDKFVKFNDLYRGTEHRTYWNKLQESLKTKLPRDLTELDGAASEQAIIVQQQALMHFWTFLKSLLHV